jgi:hypothetical protein
MQVYHVSSIPHRNASTPAQRSGIVVPDLFLDDLRVAPFVTRKHISPPRICPRPKRCRSPSGCRRISRSSSWARSGCRVEANEWNQTRHFCDRVTYPGLPWNANLLTLAVADDPGDPKLPKPNQPASLAFASASGDRAIGTRRAIEHYSCPESSPKCKVETVLASAIFQLAPMRLACLGHPRDHRPPRSFLPSRLPPTAILSKREVAQMGEMMDRKFCEFGERRTELSGETLLTSDDYAGCQNARA